MSSCHPVILSAPVILSNAKDLHVILSAAKDLHVILSNAKDLVLS